jgi:tRNA-specific 2-thiouridylase
VRAEAAERGLTVAQKPDSHDICFIPDGDTRGWLAEKVGTAQGDIVDRDGAVVGSHDGAHAYTVGQRRGLQLGVPAPDGKPRFVLEVRPVSNTVVVGPKEALATAEIAGSRHSWAGRPRRMPSSSATCRSVLTPNRCRRPPWSRGHRDGASETPFDGVARADRGAVRRHAGDRPVHDRPHRLGGSRRRLTACQAASVGVDDAASGAPGVWRCRKCHLHWPGDG